MLPFSRFTCSLQPPDLLNHSIARPLSGCAENYRDREAWTITGCAENYNRESENYKRAGESGERKHVDIYIYWFCFFLEMHGTSGQIEIEFFFRSWL
jgi:hypothetical protein